MTNPDTNKGTIRSLYSGGSLLFAVGDGVDLDWINIPVINFTEFGNLHGAVGRALVIFDDHLDVKQLAR